MDELMMVDAVVAGVRTFLVGPRTAIQDAKRYLS